MAVKNRRTDSVVGVTPLGKPERTVIAKSLMALFDKWELTNREQLCLLGLALTNRSALMGYRDGKPLAPDRDKLERASVLVGIHKSLRLIYPYNPELANSFMSSPNKAFAGMTPVEVVDREGLVGLLNIRHYLDAARGR